MRLDEAGQLLEPGHLALESGWMRLDDGQLHVAVHTPMVGCKGRMVSWWFGYVETPEHYKWWHPLDHVWCEWKGERGTGRYVGGEHHVHERIGGELQRLRIRFVEPVALLDVSRFEDAGVTAAICARVGLLDAPVWTGHLIHLVRDTGYGCEMRSRFWIGDFDPPAMAPGRDERIERIPDGIGPALLRHCHEEMSYLASFLPALHGRLARSDSATT